MNSSNGIGLQNFLKQAFEVTPLFLPATITAVLTVIGVLVAFITLRANSHFHRSKNAIDFEKTLEETEQYRVYIDHISSYRKQTSSDSMALKQLVAQPSIDREEHLAIMEALNVWERCANGIRCKVYKEKVLRKVYCTHVIRLIDYLIPFIDAYKINSQNTYVFEQVQWLHKRWKRRRKYEDYNFMKDVIVASVTALIFFIVGLLITSILST